MLFYPSHPQNLVRFFHETEVGAGEYDVVKAPAGTAPEDTVYTITAHFQVSFLLSFQLRLCAGARARARADAAAVDCGRCPLRGAPMRLKRPRFR